MLQAVENGMTFTPLYTRPLSYSCLNTHLERTHSNKRCVNATDVGTYEKFGMCLLIKCCTTQGIYEHLEEGQRKKKEKILNTYSILYIDTHTHIG